MRALIVLICFGFLTACASEVLKSYVGKPVTEAILDNGPPTNIVELEEGHRAYQWAKTNSGVIPITTPTTTNIYGSNGYATAYSSSTDYIPYSNDCIYTLTATQKGKDWVVDGFRPPSFECE
jgi:hypothetical protein